MSVIASTLSERKATLTAFVQWICIRTTVSIVKRSFLMLQDYRQGCKNLKMFQFQRGTVTANWK